MSASASNVSIKKSVPEIQSTVGTIVAFIVRVYGTRSDLRSVSSTWTAGIV